MYRKSFLPFGFCAQICAVCVLFVAVSRGKAMAQTAQISQGDYKLFGTVVNAITGEPIRRALVQIVVTQTFGVLSDSEGKFEFEGLPEGRLHVGVRKPGFFNESDIKAGPVIASGGLSFGPEGDGTKVGPDTPPLTLKLIPEGVIFGRIDTNGEPLEYISVKIFAIGIHEGGKYWEQRGETATDADGAFRASNLQPGTYYVMVGGMWNSVARIRPSAKEKEQGYGEVFYNNAEDMNGATPIEVSPGQQAETNFSLKPTSMFRVSGTINGLQGQGADLSFIGSSGVPARFPTHFNPINGQFETMVPGGAYTLEARGFNKDGSVLSANLPIRVNSDLSGIQLTLAPAISIPVDVRREDVAQARGTDLTINYYSGVDAAGHPYRGNFADASVVGLHLRPRTMSLQNQEITSSFRVNPGGQPQSQIANIEPGRYVVTFPLNSRWYVQSAQCGSVDLLHEDLTIATESQSPPIEIVLRNDPATLTGSISSESPEADAKVLVVPDGAATRTQVAYIHDGHFEMDGLAPGDYSVIALNTVQGLEYTNPEVIAPYLAHAQHVSLQGSQKSDVNVELVQVGKQ
jgi:hypothetical protein